MKKKDVPKTMIKKIMQKRFEEKMTDYYKDNQKLLKLFQIYEKRRNNQAHRTT